jgi:nucleoid DNA-binding protein
MDELVNLVVEKTGLPKETAKTVVKIVVDFLKSKLPAPIASQVDAVLSGKGAANLLGGLLGGKK